MSLTRKCCRFFGLFVALLLISLVDYLLVGPSTTCAAEVKTLADFSRWIIAADANADGSLLVTAGGESLLYRPGDVVIWKQDGSHVADLPGHRTAVWAVDVSAGGDLVATAGYDGMVKLWDLASRKVRFDLKKHTGWVRALAFSPDGSRLATAGEDGTVVLWSVQDGKPVATVKAHEGPVTAVAFSPDGKTLASGGGDKLVKLWNPSNGNQKAVWSGHQDTVWTVDFAPDGGQLVSAGADRTVRLWKVASGKPLATLTGHRDWVTSAAFHPAGNRLVSGSLDGSVKLWDVAVRREQEGPKPLKSSVWCVDFLPDGESLFIGTHAGGTIMAVPSPKLLPLPDPTLPKAASAAEYDGDGWTNLVPTSFHSAVGAIGSIAEDGSVLVTGQQGQDTYTLHVSLPPGGQLQSLRLEVLPDPSLPSQGPGRAVNGNFVLSECLLKVATAGAEGSMVPVVLTGATADYSQGGWNVAGAIDGNPETGWGIAGAIGVSHTATFEVAAKPAVPGGAKLAVVLDQQYADGGHSIGKFRLIVRRKADPTGGNVGAETGAGKQKKSSGQQQPAEGVKQ